MKITHIYSIVFVLSLVASIPLHGMLPGEKTPTLYVTSPEEAAEIEAILHKNPTLLAFCKQNQLDAAFFLRNVKEAYNQRLEIIVDRVRNHILELLHQQPQPSKPLLFIFDIDETLLVGRNLAWFLHDYSPTGKPQIAYPIRQICQLFHDITKMGIATAFLTGRPVNAAGKKGTCKDVALHKLAPSAGILFMSEALSEKINRLVCSNRQLARKEVANWKQASLVFLERTYTIAGFLDDLPENLDPKNPCHFKVPRVDDPEILEEAARRSLPSDVMPPKPS